MAMLVAAALGTVTEGAAAQQYGYQRPSRVYWGVGIGAGLFTASCDTGCYGDALNANNITVFLGAALSQRLRIEAHAMYLGATGDVGSDSHATSAGIGASLYLVKHLFVRGGVGSISIDVADTVGVSQGHGEPGYMVGAGYDVFLGGNLALTPYVHYFGGNISNVDYQAGVGTTTTKASLKAISFGVALTYRAFRRR
jgi:hypothetical protein